MSQNYYHLGIFSDWVEAAAQIRPLCPLAPPGKETQEKIRHCLGFTGGNETPRSVQVDGQWEKDGLIGEAISWSVGYGPRTQAWLLRPANHSGPLPGILALHDHGGFKFYGKEKIADGENTHYPVIQSFRDDCYGGRAYANALAKEGYAVLVHDTFMWGSRRFPYETMTEWTKFLTELQEPTWTAERLGTSPHEVWKYNTAAGLHEHLILEKYCTLLGTSMAGVVCYEDRVALNYLLSRPEVNASQIGCIGLSGGGNRSAMLLATHDAIQAAVIVGLMTTYAELLDHNVASHTWMLFPPNLSRYADWPDLAACRSPMPLLVQYDTEDNLFTPQGMKDAHERIALHYRNLGQPERYSGQFYPGPHKFDLTMQEAAFAWLKEHLGAK
ncbi:MAG: acyl-CoA thioester hydrolase/BAAT C-terminal domain-containing protein [Caldilineaceae bacterium]